VKKFAWKNYVMKSSKSDTAVRYDIVGNVGKGRTGGKRTMGTIPG
jgi:hypothetical protein